MLEASTFTTFQKWQICVASHANARGGLLRRLRRLRPACTLRGLKASFVLATPSVHPISPGAVNPRGNGLSLVLTPLS